MSDAVDQGRQIGGRRIGFVLLLLLCILVGSRWLIDGTHPEAGSTDLSEALGCALAAALLMGYATHRTSEPVSREMVEGAWRTAPFGAFALTGAALAASVATRYVNGNDATLSLALTPVIVAVAVSATATAQDDLAGRLWPGLAGIAGLLLLLPQPIWNDWRFVVALFLMPFLTGVGATAWMRINGRTATTPSDLRGDGMLPVGALAAAAVLYLLLALPAWVGRHEHSWSWTAVALDAVTALLSLGVLERLGAVRWSAQFLLVPLLTLLEGAVLLRPLLDARSWLAFGLLLVSGGYLLLRTA